MVIPAELPLVDEHETLIEKRQWDCWMALLASLESSRRARSRNWIAHLLGCRETSSNALPLSQVGATTPGFRVVVAAPPRYLTLRGSHRFSDYALEFEIEPEAGESTVLRARTKATFPGAAGALYGQVVIGTRMHAAAVASTLRAVKRGAERQPTNEAEVAL